MGLKYEPSSKPLHISAKKLFFNWELVWGEDLMRRHAVKLALPCLGVSVVGSAPKVDSLAKPHTLSGDVRADRDRALREPLAPR